MIENDRESSKDILISFLINNSRQKPSSGFITANEISVFSVIYGCQEDRQEEIVTVILITIWQVSFSGKGETT